MAHWLVKTEPSTYSIRDLERDRTTAWHGITNVAAQKNLRTMALDDGCIVYHTGDEKACVGIATIARTAYPDPGTGDTRRPVVDLRFRRKLLRPVTLATLKSYVAFRDSPLLGRGRLSILPLTDQQWNTILALADTTD